MNIYWALKRSLAETKRPKSLRLVTNLNRNRVKALSGRIRTYPCSRWGSGYWKRR